MKFHFITLFPEVVDAYVSSSILGRAKAQKKISVAYQNPRDFVSNKWGKVDERPYGGGPGMVMQALPIIKAAVKAIGRKKEKPAIVWLSPSGKPFTNADADKLCAFSSVVLVCGRYEGIDERAKKILKTLGTVKTFSVGEATYTGGELPALMICDAVVRRIPGVLGKDASVEERRIASPEVYTRPEILVYQKKTYRVPSVLKTGDHAKIDTWRQKKGKKAS